jgi:hypothetical protein
MFGSQTTIIDGRITFKPIADSQGVDERSAQWGFPR